MNPALMNAAQKGQQPAPAQQGARNIYQILENPKLVSSIEAVAGKYFTPERFLKLAIYAVRNTPRLLECDPQSVLGAFMTSAALGLEPNTPQQQAFLIPYKARAKINDVWTDVMQCQFQIGYRGFITLAYRSPTIRLLKAEAIREGDLWEQMDGSDAFLKYAKALRNRGDLLGAFCFTKLDGGVEMATVLPEEEILKIRGKSETFKALSANVTNAKNESERRKAEQKLAETPWVMWIDDMAAKSAVKKHCKQLPLAATEPVMAASVLDNDAERGILDLPAMADPDVVREVFNDGMAAPQLAQSPTFDDVPPIVGMPSAAGTRETIHVESGSARQRDTQAQQQRQPAPQRAENAEGGQQRRGSGQPRDQRPQDAPRGGARQQQQAGNGNAAVGEQTPLRRAKAEMDRAVEAANVGALDEVMIRAESYLSDEDLEEARAYYRTCKKSIEDSNDDLFGG